MKKLLIIDGNSILNRAYYGIRPLTAPDGTPTNAVYGFLNILFKHLEEEKPNYLCVAFDVKEKTFRHKKYELYKAQRRPAPDDFLVQIPIIKEVLSAMNCYCMELPGWEADDIIGTVSKMCDEQGVECKILTGDKDDLQLCSDNTTVKLVITRMGKTTTTDYGKSEFVEKYGFEPKLFIDIKALMGDSSDNIPGVKGIGEKTATALVQDYGSIDNIYSDVDGINASDSIKRKLNDGKDDAYMSYDLATIDRSAPIDFKIEDAEIKEYNNEELSGILSRLNLRSVLKRLEIEVDEKAEALPQISGNGEEVDFSKLIQVGEDAEYVSYVSREGYLYIKADNTDMALCSAADDNQIREFFANENISKVGFDVKKDMLNLSDYGIDGGGINVKSLRFDVMLAAYLLDPTRSDYPIEDLCVKYLKEVLDTKEEETQKDQISMLGMLSAEDNKPVVYAEVTAIEKLYKSISKMIEDNEQQELYYDIELPLTEVLADLQLRGMYVDKDSLGEFGKMLEERINSVRAHIYELAGEEFNINSPKQLGVILFEKLGLPGGKKNKSGSYQTNVDVLEKLCDENEIAEKVLEYRQLAKLQSTYVTGLMAVINPETGRIHSRFNQMVTSTGRISSTEPNMQNIPVRTELGKEIRRMFISERDDWSLIDADYSQIELRVLSHIADDKSMQEAFENGEDIHTRTASNVFGVPIEDVTSQMRSRAKAVNFGIVYGIGAFSLSRDIVTTRKEAQEYIDGYLKHYENVAKYMTNVVESATEKGFITTIFGRRRYMPELKSTNHNTRAFGERVAMNAPIQGSAADIIKIAMVNVYKRLRDEGLKARLVLQVHDELIVEAPNSEVRQASKILQEEMENAYKLAVPLSVDMNTGKSWYDTK